MAAKAGFLKKFPLVTIAIVMVVAGSVIFVFKKVNAGRSKPFSGFTVAGITIAAGGAALLVKPLRQVSGPLFVTGAVLGGVAVADKIGNGGLLSRPAASRWRNGQNRPAAASIDRPAAGTSRYDRPASSMGRGAYPRVAVGTSRW